MQSVARSALVRYTAAQMFALVSDVPSYPRFLPWCVGARVLPVADNEVIATVDVARSVLRTSFTTRNSMVPDRSIAMRLESGPFRSLVGEWNFDPIGSEGSRVSFRVEFEFSNRLMATALSSAFESVCATMVGAFVDRAKAVYV